MGASRGGCPSTSQCQPKSIIIRFTTAASCIGSQPIGGFICYCINRCDDDLV